MSSSDVAEAWANSFCLSCENFTPGDSFCSERCRIADTECAQVRLFSASISIPFSNLVYPFSNPAQLQRRQQRLSSCSQPASPVKADICVDKFGYIGATPFHGSCSREPSIAIPKIVPSPASHRCCSDQPPELAHVSSPLMLGSPGPATPGKNRRGGPSASVITISPPGWERHGFRTASIAYSADELLGGLNHEFASLDELVESGQVFTGMRQWPE